MKKASVPIMIVAGLFGVMAWVSVTLREQYVVTVASPLVIEVPEGWAVRTPVPPSLQLKFRGDGWRLAGLLLGGDSRLSFPAVTPTGPIRVISFNDIAERITLTPGLQLIDVKPDSVRVVLERAGRKRVPVVLDCTASFRDGYGQIGPTTVTPDSVTIMGAESLLREVTFWKTERRSFADLRTPVDVPVRLAAAGNLALELSVPTVRIGITVEPFAERVLSGVPVDVTGVPENREVILIPPKIELIVRAGIKQLSGLSIADIRVSASFTRIEADSTGAIDPDVIPPSGVQVVTRRPERLQYIVRKRL